MEINVPPALLDTPIPPMTLQLLVENAVKHNTISKTQPLKVTIVAEDSLLRISNSKTTGTIKTESFQLGLKNIHQRYRFFTSRPVIVRDEETFSVGLPLLTKAQAA
jgi:LytS/YehU family sensor histidine kinase